MIKTRIDYKGNGRVISVTRFGDTLYAHISKDGARVETLTANIMNYGDVRSIVEKIWRCLTGLQMINPPIDILVGELQRIGEDND